MVKRADGQKEITLEMIVDKADLQVTPHTARKFLKEDRIVLYELKEKPLPQPGDVTDRRKWAKARSKRTAVAGWATFVVFSQSRTVPIQCPLEITTVPVTFVLG